MKHSKFSTPPSPPSPQRPLHLLLCALALALMHARLADAHGCMNTPNQRGTLSAGNNFVHHIVDRRAPIDYHLHFPAGSKNVRPGAGHESQRRAAGPRGWTPFRPLSSSFVWRSGVCGDPKVGRQAHLRGGQYYYNGKIVSTYQQGGVIPVGISINAHHNGFIELHLCDVKKCGGEISQSCFRKGACRQLKRARHKACDSGFSKLCGPIDRKFPGRWYLPCSRYPGRDFRIEKYAPNSILYKLPDDLSCAHCVLQWFWSAANTCNPPGVLSYFNGPDRPRNWGQCPGQGGALGGVTRDQRPCAAKRFPEEYLQCADIRILPGGDRSNGHSNGRKGTPKQPPKLRPKSNPKHNAKHRPKRNNYVTVRDLLIIGNGKVIRSMNGLNFFNVRPYWSISIFAVTAKSVKKVDFFVNGRRVFTDYRTPFFIKGDKGWGQPVPWKGFPIGKRLSISARANGASITLGITFTR